MIIDNYFTVRKTSPECKRRTARSSHGWVCSTQVVTARLPPIAWLRCEPTAPWGSEYTGGTLPSAQRLYCGILDPRHCCGCSRPDAEAVTRIVLLGKSEGSEDLTDLLDQPGLRNRLLHPTNEEWPRLALVYSDVLEYCRDWACGAADTEGPPAPR